MKIYIATALERAGDHNLLRDALRREGHELTYDWTTHGSVKGQGVDRVRSVARAEAEGARTADAVVALLPGGRGTHVEIGIAIGANVPVILVGPRELFGDGAETCAFYHLGEGGVVLDYTKGWAEYVAGLIQPLIAMRDVYSLTSRLDVSPISEVSE